MHEQRRPRHHAAPLHRAPRRCTAGVRLSQVSETRERPRARM